MGFLNGIFALAGLVFFILIFVGLIKPSFVKMKSRGKAFLVFFVAFIVSCILFDATMSEEERARINEGQTKSESVQEVKTTEETVKPEEPKEVLAVANVNNEAPQVTEEEVVEQVPQLTRPQKNAIRSAEQYLSFAGFSRQGLIDQLSSSYGDGYNRADATVAVDSLNVDWNQQAVR